jgi:hypothetical protein
LIRSWQKPRLPTQSGQTTGTSSHGLEGRQEKAFLSIWQRDRHRNPRQQVQEV